MEDGSQNIIYKFSHIGNRKNIKTYVDNLWISKFYRSNIYFGNILDGQKTTKNISSFINKVC